MESRVVAPDYTVRWEGRSYQIARAAIRPGLRGARVRVEKRLDRSVAVRFREYNSLDSIWTPVVNVSEFGLHPDSTSIWIPPGFRSQ